MQPLSKEAEARITGALNDVIDLVNGGASPTDAMAKVATEKQLPAGHVNLMVNAFNIGRSEAQRKGTADLFEKASEFELADASRVLDRMFPEAVKTAGVLAEETVVSAEYGAPPRFLADRARREKLAAAGAIDWKLVDPPPALPRDPATAVKRAHARLVSQHRAFEETRRTAQHFFDLANEKIAALARDLSRPDAPPFRAVRDDAVVMFGEKAAAVLDVIAAGHKHLTKQSAAGRGGSPAALCARVGEILEAADSFERAREAFEKAAEAKDREAAETARPFFPAAQERGSVLGPCSEKRAFLGGMFGTMVGSSLGRGIGDKLVKPTDALQAGMKNKMSDPQHEAQLRNIQTESMLNDLMANDEVISGYDPNEVVTHFNEISQLSPRSTNQGGLMRALLRKRLQQGALDPYEVDMLLKIENGLKSRDNTGTGGVLNGSAGVL